jgi:hypothetical protein
MYPNNIANRRAVISARLLLQPAGTTSGYINVGDTDNLKETVDQSRGAISVWDYGYRRKVEEPLDEIGRKFEMDLHEGHNQNLLLLGLATQNSDVVQSAQTAPNGTATINPAALDTWYPLGKYDVSTVVVTVSSVVRTENVDYEIDYKAGLIRIIPGGGISAGASVGVTYANAARTQESFSYLTTPRRSGLARICLYDQHYTALIDQLDFSATWWISDFGQLVGHPRNTPPKLCVMATTKPTRLALKITA